MFEEIAVGEDMGDNQFILDEVLLRITRPRHAARSSQKYGVQEYWIVDPTFHVYACRMAVTRYVMYTEQETIQSIVFKDLQVPMNRLFSLE